MTNRVVYKSYRSLHNVLIKLRKSGKRFYTEDTSGTFKIRQGNNSYECCNGEKDIRSLGTYMKVKAEILSKPKQKLTDLSPTLKYWLIKEKPFGKTIQSVTNIDIKKAYPYAFFHQGFISKEVLDYLIDLDNNGYKQSRLRGMGMLARIKVRNHYRGSNVIKGVLVEDKYLRNTFFKACKIIDDLMLKCVKLAGDNCLFYWFDGIYIDTSEEKGKGIVKKICRLIEESKYKFSEEVLQDFSYMVKDKVKCSPYVNRSFPIEKVVHIKFKKKNSKGEIEEKTFSLPLNNSIKTRID